MELSKVEYLIRFRKIEPLLIWQNKIETLEDLKVAISEARRDNPEMEFDAFSQELKRVETELDL